MKEQSKTLTNVQMKFIDQYLEDPSDGGAAYMRASNSANKKSCTVQASKLLKMEKVQDALKQRAEDILGPVHARILKNVEFWLDIRDGNQPGARKGNLISRDEVLDIIDMIGADASKDAYKKINALDKYEVVLDRTADRMKASENLGKYMQMFVEKKEINLTAAVTIVDDIT